MYVYVRSADVLSSVFLRKLYSLLTMSPADLQIIERIHWYIDDGDMV